MLCPAVPRCAVLCCWTASAWLRCAVASLAAAACGSQACQAGALLRVVLLGHDTGWEPVAPEDLYQVGFATCPSRTFQCWQGNICVHGGRCCCFQLVQASSGSLSAEGVGVADESGPPRLCMWCMSTWWLGAVLRLLPVMSLLLLLSATAGVAARARVGASLRRDGADAAAPAHAGGLESAAAVYLIGAATCWLERRQLLFGRGHHAALCWAAVRCATGGGQVGNSLAV